jgi:ADP-heptose:LPS heptosyltransferase
MHTGLAETAKERAWPKNKWVELIQKVVDKDKEVKIVLSGTK